MGKAPEIVDCSDVYIVAVTEHKQRTMAKRNMVENKRLLCDFVPQSLSHLLCLSICASSAMSAVSIFFHLSTPVITVDIMCFVWILQPSHSFDHISGTP